MDNQAWTEDCQVGDVGTSPTRWCTPSPQKDKHEIKSTKWVVRDLETYSLSQSGGIWHVTLNANTKVLVIVKELALCLNAIFVELSCFD